MVDLHHISFEGVETHPPAAPWRTETTRRHQVARDARGAEQPKLDPFLGWLLRRGGVEGKAYRASAMQRRLPACLRQLRVASPGAARELIERRPELAPAALNAVLIGVSDFFRDEEVFSALAAEVVPELSRMRPGARILSAGCSSGQELYSVAILLAESGALERCELVGLDCREDAIARAVEGAFDDHELDGIGSSRLARFFAPEEGRWRARDGLRGRLRWRVGDLLSSGADGAWDLILFRNVAIYLEDEHLAALWERLVSALAPGGVLVTGKAEKPPPSLPLRRIAPCVYRLTR